MSGDAVLGKQRLRGSNVKKLSPSGRLSPLTFVADVRLRCD
jgi:hypothetical protein